MRVVIFANFNGYGLSKDVEILHSVLTGHEVTVSKPTREVKGLFDIAYHCEHLIGRNLPSARINVAVPNIEWMSRATGLVLKRCDYALAKTRYSERLLNEHYPEVKTIFTGWTSPDPWIENEPREKGIVHVGGMSPLKSTREVILALGDTKLPSTVHWGRHPTGIPPNVTFIKKRVDRPPFSKNIHVQPSQMEGFGHHLNEALACGCTLVTTDHPPMNDFYSKYLVPITAARPQTLQGIASLAHLDATELKRQIFSAWEHAPLFDPNGREDYLARDKAFREAFKQLPFA